MIDYNSNICADCKVNSEGYNELVKVIDYIAEKCQFEKEIIIEDNIAKEIILKYIKNNEVVDTISLHLEPTDERNLIGLFVNNKETMVLNPELYNVILYVCEYAEKIVEFDCLTKVYDLFCEKAEKLQVKFDGKIVGEDSKELDIKIYANTVNHRDYLLTLFFRLDYDDIYGEYNGCSYDSKDILTIELANEDIDFLVNACMYHLEDFIEDEE